MLNTSAARKSLPDSSHSVTAATPLPSEEQDSKKYSIPSHRYVSLKRFLVHNLYEFTWMFRLLIIDRITDTQGAFLKVRGSLCSVEAVR